jgi:outer membrane protein, multidrug efflux system
MLDCPRMTALTLLVIASSTPASAQQRISLDQAYALALKNNPTMLALRERSVQAEAALRKAWSAIKPTANAQGTFTHYDISIVFDPAKAMGVSLPGVEPIVIQKQDQFAWSALVNVPLFRGPAYPRIGIARKGVASTQLRELRSRQDFLLRVAQAYYLIVSRGDAVRALVNKVALDRKHLASARAQFEVGQAARSTVLRADLVLTQDEQSLRAQRNSLDAARRQLAILVGLPGLVDGDRPPEPASPRGTDHTLLAGAMSSRLDFKAAQVALEMAQQSERASWWGFFPTLDLGWMYRWSEVAGFAPSRGSWNLMFILNLPLYDGGVRYADLRDARSKILEAQEQKRALGQEIESEIVRLRAEVDSANAGVISARKALSLAKVTAEDMEASFEVGAATQLDVLDTSQRMLDAELALTGSLYTRDLARLALTHAMGQFDPVRGK